jgi:predicted acetyltransferase
MLSAALPVAARLGINMALVTCDVDNVASRRVIEANGGIPDRPGDGKLRFWIPTSGSGVANTVGRPDR